MKLKFDNVGMELFTKSMDKLFMIEHLCIEEKTHDKLFKKGFIGVATMPDEKLSNVQLLAKQYRGNKSVQLQDLSTEDNLYSFLYVKTFGKFFQVAKVVTSVNDGNDFLMNSEDVALIGTIKATDETPEMHIIASIKEAKCLN